MIPDISILQLPNISSISIDDNFSYDAIDFPTKPGSIDDAYTQLKALRERKDCMYLPKAILNLSIENRSIILKFEKLLLYCQQENFKDEIVRLVDISQLNSEVFTNEDLLYISTFTINSKYLPKCL